MGRELIFNPNKKLLDMRSCVGLHTTYQRQGCTISPPEPSSSGPFLFQSERTWDYWT